MNRLDATSSDTRNRDQLKILLLQIRDGAQVRMEEHLSFAEYCGVALEQIDILNVFDTPDFPVSAADNYDALLVGGASEANVLKPDQFPFIQACQNLIRHCGETAKPVFASCFGFQLAVLALGGEILHKDAGFEMGTIPVSLTSAAVDDLLFQDTPDGFSAISVHRQYADGLPGDCQLLAYTEQCAHSFKLKGKPFWAFQFHPEVDKATLIERLTFYKSHYTDGDGQLDRVLSSAVETPESNILVRKFVDRVLLKQT
ncbi:type 1 glutamine amidotransferase [Amphritea japonica]|uniref:GMP synthase (Glutamine-hydrolysing) n=1 Tax=Amphritea japonica ATCC BAA-1530 TaxID=1278309 RepID=A0A7R6STT7_9GAMM|nr:type 1 glutamine amidotransferase [Amphritea japonica]BBB27640.1 GMP synthase (glutamine-hydrolysing) [Amphritea japonica ATCC BAA-1530]